MAVQVSVRFAYQPAVLHLAILKTKSLTLNLLAILFLNPPPQSTMALF